MTTNYKQRNIEILLCERLNLWCLIVISETKLLYEVGFIAQLIERAGLQRGQPSSVN